MLQRVYGRLADAAELVLVVMALVTAALVVAWGGIF
jgi:hypothetical protein